MSSYDVKVHDLGKRDDRGKSKSHRVRWVVAGKRFERSFTTKALADKFRNDLLRAQKDGTPFDEATGLPESLLRERNRTTWYEHARAYAEMKWPGLAAKSRRSVVEALVTVTVALVNETRGQRDDEVLRRALYEWALNPNAWQREAPADQAEAIAWLARASRPVVELAKPDVVRAALTACSRRIDGRPAAATTVQRKRAVLYNALRFAVERDLLDYNPLDKVQWTAPRVAETVDRRVVANTAQVEAILAALPSVNREGGRYVAFFGCMYYGGMRPAEAANLRRADLFLPASGWGRVILTETNPYAGSGWTDDGDGRERRGLKHRGENETRTVPIPPELVKLLRDHIAEYGVTADGRLFRGRNEGHLASSTYDRMWKDARVKGLSSELVLSPLAGRPYDLRHAAVSLWLNGGVPATEVARRAGHSVAVLLRVYASCIDGEEETVNAKIQRALAAGRGRGRIGGNVGRAGATPREKRQVRRIVRRPGGDAL